MNTCYICYNENLSVIKFTCSHEICIKCFLKLRNLKCPYCNKEFEDRLKDLKKLIYFVIILITTRQ